MSFVRWAAGFVLAAFFMPIAAFGQGAVLQSGVVTPGHFTVWLHNGIIGDVGAVGGLGPYLPLTGGTVVGPTTFNAPLTVNGIFADTRTFTSLPTSSFTGVFTANVNYQTTPLAEQSAVRGDLNDNGDSSGNGTGTFNQAGIFTAYANATDNNSGGDTSGNAFDFGIHPSCLHNNPTGGLPAGAALKNCEAAWILFQGANNEYGSQSGVEAIVEEDYGVNGMDDVGNRPAHQLLFVTQTPVTSGGWSDFTTTGFLLSAETADASTRNIFLGDYMQVGPNFANAAIDLQQANSYSPIITSTTPGSSVMSVTVDNILPLAGGNVNFLSIGVGGGGIADMAAKTKTATASVTGSTFVPLSDVHYLHVGMFAYDLTSPSGITVGAWVSAISSSGVTLTINSTVAHNDVLLFASGQKQVFINGDGYRVAGVILAAAGSPAGTVYFTTSVTVADATHGVAIVPEAHDIWLGDGGAANPWSTIAFGVSGVATIGGDGANGITMQGASTESALTIKHLYTTITSEAGLWSGANWGQQLLLTTSNPGNDDPALGFTDTSGANLWGIADANGVFQFAKMPARNDTTTLPVLYLNMASNAVTVGGGTTSIDLVLPNAPTTCSGHPSKTVWNNAGVLNICP